MKTSKIIAEITKNPPYINFKDIKALYVFGSSLIKDDPNDIDIGIIVDEMHPMFNSQLVILSQKHGMCEYHFVPNTRWHKKMFMNFSRYKRISKIHLRIRGLR